MPSSRRWMPSFSSPTWSPRFAVCAVFDLPVSLSFLRLRDRVSLSRQSSSFRMRDLRRRVHASRASGCRHSDRVMALHLLASWVRRGALCVRGAQGGKTPTPFSEASALPAIGWSVAGVLALVLGPTWLSTAALISAADHPRPEWMSHSRYPILVHDLAFRGCGRRIVVAPTLGARSMADGRGAGVHCGSRVQRPASLAFALVSAFMPGECLDHYLEHRSDRHARRDEYGSHCAWRARMRCRAVSGQQADEPGGDGRRHLTRDQTTEAAMSANSGAAIRFIQREPVDRAAALSALTEVKSDCRRAEQILQDIRALFGKGDQGQERIDVNETARAGLWLYAARSTSMACRFAAS